MARTKRYFNSHIVNFQTATNDTIEMLEAGLAGVDVIFKEGAEFKKAGVMLTGLVSQQMVQKELFDSRDRSKYRRLMTVIDSVNSRSESSLFMASEGINQPWQTKFQHRSQRYTTNWNELLVVC